MGTDDFDTLGLRRAFRAEVKRSTHATVLAAGFIAIFALPAWAGFDHLVEPEHATTFTAIRFGLEVPLIGLWLALFTRVGRRHPELIGLLMLTLIEVSIAFMISRLEEAYAPYTLGLSLAIYGSAFLLIWPWRYTAALVGLTWLAVGVAIATAPEPLSHQAIATVAFYLGTASLVGFVGQFFRQAIAFKEFSSRIELEQEHERNEQLRRQLERLSREDPLTGLANRRSWDETLAREFERSRRQEGSLAIILCDLDRLKDVNDRFGHATGDRVLKAAADVIRERVRAGDLAARLGGDEFAVLCPDTEPEGAGRLAEELRARLAGLSSSGEALPEVTVSIGVTVRAPQDLTATDLMLRVDNRLYRAKSTRNAVWLDAPVGAV